ncbi:MAG: DNA/RNA non-specific endonuclease [Clostridia bacterium]|nr:DNA/RNA non-specific endonuclease [Clostridia bacterium]
MKKLTSLVALLLVLCLSLGGCDLLSMLGLGTQSPISLDEVPAYSGPAYVEINGNVPSFTDEEKAAATASYEFYSELDALGRCGYAEASVGIDIMPTEERGSIGSVKPSGWHTVKYDVVDGKYLYNRCHLVGYQLTGENANEKNLITGTRYLNIEGMLDFENMIAHYVTETENHVLYRVTPIFEGSEPVARGVLMEGWSVEDDGAGVCFSVYAYNVQPGVTIDYATGKSWLSGEEPPADDAPDTPDDEGVNVTYILNISTRRFHLPTCSSVSGMSEKNKQEFVGSRDDLLSDDFVPCGTCKP